MENYDFVQKMREKNRFVTNSNINNPDSKSEFYISENDRLFGDNFATGEYLRRKQENEKKKEKYKFRQNQLFERERKRWERLDYEYLRKENQSMMNKERNLVGRKNNPGMAFNPLNLQYDNSVQGEILKRRDEESKYRAWLRSINIDKHSNTGYNIINGEERTILEERLNKDIVPDIIQKNIDQINEMKNKVIFNSNNFYTRCNPAPETRGYRYDNSNMNGNYSNSFGNRNNKSTSTPNVLNNNGGRYRAPIDLRDEPKLFNNNYEVTRSNILPRGNNNFLNNINEFNTMNNRNQFSPPRLPRNFLYEMNDINSNMNNSNNNRNNNFNNNFNKENNNNNYNDNFNNNERNNINNNQYNNERNKNVTPNVGIIDLNNMDSNNQDFNNNTINNKNFMNNRNNNFNEFNLNNNRNEIPRSPNINNMKENENNRERNDFHYKGSVTITNNIEQRDYEQNNFQEKRPLQSNYHVNPYNPYSKPDFYLMSK